jgi:tyrosine-protein kinase Etk/Wzc
MSTTIKNKQEEKNGNILEELLFRFVPYWPLFILMMIICSAGAWMYLKFVTPKYEAYAKVLLKDEKKGR